MLVSGAARSPVGAPALSVWTILRRTGFFLLPDALRDRRGGAGVVVVRRVRCCRANEHGQRRPDDHYPFQWVSLGGFPTGGINRNTSPPRCYRRKPEECSGSRSVR